MRHKTTAIASIALTSLLTSAVFAGNHNHQSRQVQVPQQVVVDNGSNNQTQNGNTVRQVIIDNGGGSQGLAYFSPRLGARFLIQSIQIGNFPSVMAARIVSDPMPGSPLEQLGLEIGDVITRLDGIPVTNTAELERHIFDTKVRFVRAGASWVSRGTMWIAKNRYFQETFYPPFDQQCNTCGLRP